nr:uncharacterized protein LOC109769274 isoform X1 [Aegilops tauschii subsp. strangulata]
MQRISDTTTLPFAMHYLRSRIMEELDTSHLTERLLQGWSRLDDAEVVIFVGPVTAYAYSFNFSLLLLKGIGTFPAKKRNRTVLLPKDKSKNNKNPAPTMNSRSKQNKQTKSCRPSRKGCSVEEQQVTVDGLRGGRQSRDKRRIPSCMCVDLYHPTTVLLCFTVINKEMNQIFFGSLAKFYTSSI